MHGMYGNVNFEVDTTDLLTDEDHIISITQTGKILTQEDAEVHVYTQPTAFGGNHPGSEVRPKNKALFDKALAEWIKKYPVLAKRILTRSNWVKEHPEEAQELRSKLEAVGRGEKVI